MAELRVKETGTIKLFESDNTSSVTIASPASLGADRTITLPDASVTLASGTMLATDGSGASLTALNASELGSGTVPAARLSGVGKVLQVVSASASSEVSTTSSSFQTKATPAPSITTSALNSNIVVMGHVGNAWGDGALGGISFRREITGGASTDNIFGGSYGAVYTTKDAQSQGSYTIVYLDTLSESASTTITYKFNYRSNGVVTGYFGYSALSETITLWEIAA